MSEKRKMMTGSPNAVSTVMGATEAIYDDEYWQERAARLDRRIAALTATIAERDAVIAALRVELEIAAEDMELASMAIITDATTLTLADRQMGLSLARSAKRARAALGRDGKEDTP